MDMELCYIKIIEFIKENGIKILDKEGDYKFFKMAIYIKDNTYKANRMVQVDLYGSKNVNLKANGKMA